MNAVSSAIIIAASSAAQIGILFSPAVGHAMQAAAIGKSRCAESGFSTSISSRAPHSARTASMRSRGQRGWMGT